MRRVTFGLALALALGAGAAGAVELPFQSRNCESGQRALRIRAFDGADLFQLIPASMVELLPYGQTADLRCDDSGRRYCKITVVIMPLDSVAKDYEIQDSSRYQCFYGHKSGYYFDTRCHQCPP